MILVPDAKLICKTLVENDMDVDKTYDTLKHVLSNSMTKKYIADIKDKKIWCAVSHFYFK